MTLGIILTIVLFFNWYFSVTPKYCCNSNRWQIKVYGDENPALTAVVTGTVNGDTINYTLATATQFSNVGQYPDVTLGII
jgi:hypothetical protein